MNEKETEEYCKELGITADILLKHKTRYFYEDSWTETTVDWKGVAELIEKVTQKEVVE